MEQFSQKTGASKLLTAVFIVLGILIGAGGVWYYMDQKATDDKAALQAQIDALSEQVSDLKAASSATTDTATDVTTPNADEPSATPTASDTNISAARSKVNEFEVLNSKANAQSSELLAFFTPAATAVETSFYNYLTGADAAAPRLKATATYSYTISSYTVDSLVKNGTKYVANVTENRVITDNSTSSGRQSTNVQKKTIEIVQNSGGTFMIDKYYSQGVTGDIASTTGGDATAQKYEGFYTK